MRSKIGHGVKNRLLPKEALDFLLVFIDMQIIHCVQVRWTGGMFHEFHDSAMTDRIEDGLREEAGPLDESFFL
jgi:hypothetical protein